MRSYAALALAVATFVVVVLSPAPRRPAGGAASTAERLLVLAGQEDMAVGEDRREIARLSERLVQATADVEGSDDLDHSNVIRAEVEAELDSRWADFSARLREAREYRHRR